MHKTRIVWFLDYSSHLCSGHIGMHDSCTSWILIFNFIIKQKNSIKEHLEYPLHTASAPMHYCCCNYHFYENLHCNICIARTLWLASESLLQYVCICATITESLFQNIPSKPYQLCDFSTFETSAVFFFFDKSIYFLLFWIYEKMSWINKNVYCFP